MITSPSPPAQPPAWPALTAQSRPAAMLHAAVHLAGGANLAAKDVSGVITSTTAWIVGVLAGLATLMLTVGGIRYLFSGHDPGQLERAKGSFKAAVAGYALALLAPVLVSIVQRIVG